MNFALNLGLLGNIQSLDSNVKEHPLSLSCYAWNAHDALVRLMINNIDTQLVGSDLGSESTTGHCRLSVLQMPANVNEWSTTIRLSERVTHAPPPAASEIHTCLGNIELGRKYGMPAHLCEHDGKLYISRLVRSKDPTGTSPFVILHIQAGMTLMGLIGAVACSYEDLADCWEHTPWWVVPIDKSCRSSSSKIFRSQHLLLILGDDYWHFRLRPQGIIEMVCGEGSLQFVTTLPKNANKEIVLDLLAAVLPPPNLQFLIRMWLNGVELLNKLVGMTNGFYLRIEVNGNFRLGKEILRTPYRLLSTLHEAPPSIIHTPNSECCCFLPGRAFFLGCRTLIVQGERKTFESMLLSIIERCCPDFRRDAFCMRPVHSSFSDFQPVLNRDRDTVVAVLLSLPADMVTVLVSLHLRKLTFTGAVWIRSDSTITSFLYHLGLNQLCGVRGEACWIVHNGEPVLSDQMFLGQGDVIFVWQKYDHEMAGSTVTPGVARALRGC